MKHMILAISICKLYKYHELINIMDWLGVCEIQWDNKGHEKILVTKCWEGFVRGKTHGMCHGKGKYALWWYLPPILTTCTRNHTNITWEVVGHAIHLWKSYLCVLVSTTMSNLVSVIIESSRPDKELTGHLSLFFFFLSSSSLSKWERPSSCPWLRIPYECEVHQHKEWYFLSWFWTQFGVKLYHKPKSQVESACTIMLW